MEYSYNPDLPLDLSGIKITLGENQSNPPLK